MSTTRLTDAELARLGFSRPAIDALRSVFRRSSAENPVGVTLDQVDVLLGDLRAVVFAMADRGPEIEALRLSVDALYTALMSQRDSRQELQNMAHRIDRLETLTGAA